MSYIQKIINILLMPLSLAVNAYLKFFEITGITQWQKKKMREKTRSGQFFLAAFLAYLPKTVFTVIAFFLLLKVIMSTESKIEVARLLLSSLIPFAYISTDSYYKGKKLKRNREIRQSRARYRKNLQTREAELQKAKAKHDQKQD